MGLMLILVREGGNEQGLSDLIILLKLMSADKGKPKHTYKSLQFLTC